MIPARRHLFRTLLRFAVLLIGILPLTACNLAAKNDPTATPTIVVTPTPQDTATPTPMPEKVVLVAPNENTALAQAAHATLAELAPSGGLQLEVRPAIGPSDIAPEWKVVVLLAVQANLPELLAAAPQTQFVVVSPVALESGANLTVIHQDPTLQAFLAGYMAEVLAADWRAAGLLPSDSQAGSQLEEAFRNGGNYFCGTCNMLYPPYVRFPLVGSLPSGSDAQAWQSAAETLEQSTIYVIYVAPEASSPELMSYLAQKGLTILGGQTPPDEARANYAGTVSSDVLVALQELWPAVLAGNGGQSVSARLQISDVNPALLPPGRQLLAEGVIKDLESGLLSPLSVPLE